MMTILFLTAYAVIAARFFYWATWSGGPAPWRDIGKNAVWAVLWLPIGIVWLCMTVWVVWTFQRSLAE